jgi:hypothetical protein
MGCFDRRARCRWAEISHSAPGVHTAAPEAWQFALQSTNSSKINVLNNLATIHTPSLQLQLQWIANELKSMAERRGKQVAELPSFTLQSRKENALPGDAPSARQGTLVRILI